MSRSIKAQRLIPCMPPLMEEETKPLSRARGDTRYGGSACELAVKNYFLSRSINIAEPHVDVGVDLLIEKPEPEGWVRGQVKKVVYHLDMDDAMYKRTGEKVYRSRFNFNFQGGGKTAPHLKNGRAQKGPKDFGYFYHVLLTPYRQLIWEIPVGLISLREDGTFVHGKTQCLDRDNWKRKPADIEWRNHLIHCSYDPIIFKTFTDFFMKPTMCDFFRD